MQGILVILSKVKTGFMKYSHLTGCELDPEYFEKGIQRVKEQTKQLKLI